MKKKLSQRKSSRLVTNSVVDALRNLSHLEPEERSKLCHESIKQRQEIESAPALIQVIRRLGVIDACRGYTDDDVRALVRANDLADREIRAPGDFVSAGSFAAGQANSNGKAVSYDRDAIRQEARKVGYFELKKGSHRRRVLRLRIVANLNLRNDNPSNSDDSWNRQIARILDEDKKSDI